MTPRVVLTGAAGVIGSVLSKWFTRDYPDCVLVDRRPGSVQTPELARLTLCDLESRESVRALIDSVEPDVVVHLAGNKDVFALEKSPETARRANVDTTRHLAEALQGSQALVVFISSDYVFEGNDGPYSEKSPTHPRTEYGRSKLAAEELLRVSGLPVAIARSASLFGFEGDFVSLVRSTLLQGKDFIAFSDLVSNPTSVTDLFVMLRRIIDGRLTGTFHAAGAESVSRAEFARKVAVASLLSTSLIRETSREERIRPADLSLQNSATYEALAHFPASLEEALRG